MYWPMNYPDIAATKFEHFSDSLLIYRNCLTNGTNAFIVPPDRELASHEEISAYEIIERISSQSRDSFSNDVILGLGLLKNTKSSFSKQRRPSSLVIVPTFMEPSEIEVEITKNRNSTLE